jgi:hypothetical protein
MSEVYYIRMSVFSENFYYVICRQLKPRHHSDARVCIMVQNK